jgi:hypothetical protein
MQDSSLKRHHHVHPQHRCDLVRNVFREGYILLIISASSVHRHIIDQSFSALLSLHLAVSIHFSIALATALYPLDDTFQLSQNSKDVNDKTTIQILYKQCRTAFFSGKPAKGTIVSSNNRTTTAYCGGTECCTRRISILCQLGHKLWGDGHSR